MTQPDAQAILDTTRAVADRLDRIADRIAALEARAVTKTDVYDAVFAAHAVTVTMIAVVIVVLDLTVGLRG